MPSILRVSFNAFTNRRIGIWSDQVAQIAREKKLVKVYGIDELEVISAELD